MRPHVLDANALYKFLTYTKGSEIVADLFRRANVEGSHMSISAVNWGEVYYTLVKAIGSTKTENLLAGLVERLPLQVVAADQERARRAARLKAQFNIPYGDAFAAELAGKDGVVVTADQTDFQKVPKLRLVALSAHKRQS